MKQNRGWIYREPGEGVTPNRIRVEIQGYTVQVFNDNHVGAKLAAEYITHQLGNNWKLEDMAFLGYRIVVDDG